MLPPWAQGTPLPPGVVYMPPYYQPPPYYRHPGAPLIPIPPYPGYPMPHVPPEYLAHYPTYVYPMYTTAHSRPPWQGPSTALPSAVQEEAKELPAEKAPVKEDSEDDDDDGGSEDAEGEPDGDDSSIDMDEPVEQDPQRDPTNHPQESNGSVVPQAGESAEATFGVDPNETATSSEKFLHDGEPLMLNPGMWLMS